MLLSDFPDCNTNRIFASTFYFPSKSLKSNKNKRIFRNTIYSVKEYKKMNDSGKVKNRAELAQKIGISRAGLNKY